MNARASPQFMPNGVQLCWRKVWHIVKVEMHIMFADDKYLFMCLFIDAFIPASTERRPLSCTLCKMLCDCVTVVIKCILYSWFIFISVYG